MKKGTWKVITAAQCSECGAIVEDVEDRCPLCGIQMKKETTYPEQVTITREEMGSPVILTHDLHSIEINNGKLYIEIGSEAAPPEDEADNEDEDEEPSPEIYRKGFFNIDGGPAFEGFTTGQTWNGWAMPHFTKENADKIVASMNSNNPGYARYDKESDSYIFKDSCSHDEFPSKLLGILHGKDVVSYLKIYPIGTGCWTWDELNKKEDLCWLCQEFLGNSPVKSDATKDAVFCTTYCLYEALTNNAPGDGETKIIEGTDNADLECPHCKTHYRSVTDRAGSEGPFIVPDHKGFAFDIMTCPHCGGISPLVVED